MAVVLCEFLAFRLPNLLLVSRLKFPGKLHEYTELWDILETLNRYTGDSTMILHTDKHKNTIISQLKLDLMQIRPLNK